jgi:phage replication O-like protein O
VSKLLIPNVTAVPNILFDRVFLNLRPGALRVLLAVVRLTYGWQKVSDRISYTQLQKVTGLSREGVRQAMKELGDMLTIKPGARGRGANEYSLNINISTGELVRKVDQSEKLTMQVGSQKSRLFQIKSKSSTADRPQKSSTAGGQSSKGNASAASVGFRQAMATYHDRFVLKFGAKPDIDGRDGKLLSGLVKSHGADEVIALLALFFDRPPEWVAKKGKFTVPTFKSVYTELLAQSRSGKMQMGVL